MLLCVVQREVGRGRGGRAILVVVAPFLFLPHLLHDNSSFQSNNEWTGRRPRLRNLAGQGELLKKIEKAETAADWFKIED